jgi:hypothetical protein
LAAGKLNEAIPMNLLQVHATLANACLIFSLIIAGYGFVQYFRKQGVDSNFLGTLAAGELLFVAQGVVGIVLFASGAAAGAPRILIHILYGTVLVISIPGTYAVIRGRDTRREALIYAVIGLFLAGITLRAMYTALH